MQTHLVAEVARGELVHETVLVLKAVLCHVKRFLHRHGEGGAESQYHANEENDDVREVDVVGDTSWRAHKRQAFEVHEPVVDKHQQHGAEDDVAPVDDEARDRLDRCIRHVAREARCEQKNDGCAECGVPLENQSQEGLRSIARMKDVIFEVVCHLAVFLQCLAEDN